jgi:hypothetical protein
MYVDTTNNYFNTSTRTVGDRALTFSSSFLNTYGPYAFGLVGMYVRFPTASIEIVIISSDVDDFG